MKVTKFLTSASNVEPCCCSEYIFKILSTIAEHFPAPFTSFRQEISMFSSNFFLITLNDYLELWCLFKKNFQFLSKSVLLNFILIWTKMSIWIELYNWKINISTYGTLLLFILNFTIRKNFNLETYKVRLYVNNYN